MAEHNDLGAEGENIAAEFLKKNNYEILERNWKHRQLEVDIIAKINKLLVIVEVKTRSGNFLELPQNAVNKQKQNFLVEAANAYVVKNNIDLDVRFDIVTVVFKNGMQQVFHIKDAFYPRISKF